MSIKPLADRVLIEPIAAETKTASGLYIPDNAKEKPSQGKVVAIGNDEDLTVKIGDTVIYGKFSGTKIDHEGVEYLIMPESEILAII
jgi:chaperonin GroES